MLLLLTLVACQSEATVHPTSGWYVVDAAQTDWSCGTAGPASGVQSEGLVWVEVGESWRWADATDGVACDFDGPTFSCELFDTGVAYAESSNTQASVSWSARIEGWWTAGADLEGEITADYQCSGGDCDDIASSYGPGFAFPCEASTTWVAPFAGEAAQ